MAIPTGRCEGAGPTAPPGPQEHVAAQEVESDFHLHGQAAILVHVDLLLNVIAGHQRAELGRCVLRVSVVMRTHPAMMQGPPGVAEARPLRQHGKLPRPAVRLGFGVDHALLGLWVLAPWHARKRKKKEEKSVSCWRELQGRGRRLVKSLNTRVTSKTTRLGQKAL